MTALELIQSAWEECTIDYETLSIKNSNIQPQNIYTNERMNSSMGNEYEITEVFYDNELSTIVYKSNKDNSIHRAFIEDNKIFTKDTLTSKISAENYGDIVSYVSDNQISDWKLFYSDGVNIFLISADYIPIEKIPAEDGTCWGYWLSSPSASHGDYLYTVKSDHCGVGPSQYSKSRAIRVVVALKPTVNGNYLDGKWILE